jgi:hypothetical protein
MSIKPIDLQTLFMHMNQVGKEQAQQREGVLMQQAVVGSELVQESEHADSSVNQTQATSDGPEEIHEDEEQTGGRRRKRKKREGEAEDASQSESKYYKDPDLGNNIDITG